MFVGLKHANFDSESLTNSMQMTHNKRDNPIAFFFKTFHHGQFPCFHRRREEKAKLSPPWDATNFEPKLLIKSTHSFLPGKLSGVTSPSKTFNQDFSHSIVRARPARQNCVFHEKERGFAVLDHNFDPSIYEQSADSLLKDETEKIDLPTLIPQIHFHFSS